MTQIDVLNFIKQRLGHPYVPLELTDELIVTDIIQKEALQMYSNFYPFIEYRQADMTMLPEFWVDFENEQPNESPHNITESNMIMVKDEDLIAVMEIFGGQRNMDFTQIDRHKYLIHEDIHTRYIDIVLKMKKYHRKDLSTIKPQDYRRFMELCLILTAQRLLPIRKFASQISTPVGEIQLDVETVQTLADSWQEFKEKELDNVRTFARRSPLIIR